MKFFTANTAINVTIYVNIDNDCTRDYNITFIVSWQPKAG